MHDYAAPLAMSDELEQAESDLDEALAKVLSARAILNRNGLRYGEYRLCEVFPIIRSVKDTIRRVANTNRIIVEYNNWTVPSSSLVTCSPASPPARSNWEPSSFSGTLRIGA